MKRGYVVHEHCERSFSILFSSFRFGFEAQEARRLGQRRGIYHCYALSGFLGAPFSVGIYSLTHL